LGKPDLTTDCMGGRGLALQKHVILGGKEEKKRVTA